MDGARVKETEKENPLLRAIRSPVIQATVASVCVKSLAFAAYGRLLTTPASALSIALSPHAIAGDSLALACGGMLYKTLSWRKEIIDTSGYLGGDDTATKSVAQWYRAWKKLMRRGASENLCVIAGCVFFYKLLDVLVNNPDLYPLPLKPMFLIISGTAKYFADLSVSQFLYCLAILPLAHIAERKLSKREWNIAAAGITKRKESPALEQAALPSYSREAHAGACGANTAIRTNAPV